MTTSIVLLSGDVVITTGGALIIAVVTTFGVVQSAMIAAGRNQNKKVLQGVRTTVAQTEKTGNGYADRSMAKLDRLIHDLATVRNDVGGLRADLRDVSRRVDRNSQRMDLLTQEKPQ